MSSNIFILFSATLRFFSLLISSQVFFTQNEMYIQTSFSLEHFFSLIIFPATDSSNEILETLYFQKRKQWKGSRAMLDKIKYFITGDICYVLRKMNINITLNQKVRKIIKMYLVLSHENGIWNASVTFVCCGLFKGASFFKKNK